MLLTNFYSKHYVVVWHRPQMNARFQNCKRKSFSRVNNR